MSDTRKTAPLSLKLSTKQRQDYIQFLLTRKKNPPRLRETKPRGMNAALLPEPPRPTFKIEWKKPKAPGDN